MHHLGYDLPSFSDLPMQIKYSFPRLWKSMINGSLPVQGKNLAKLLLTDALSQLIVPTGGESKKGLCFFSHLLGEDFQFSSVQNAGWLLLYRGLYYPLVWGFFQKPTKMIPEAFYQSAQWNVPRSTWTLLKLTWYLKTCLKSHFSGIFRDPQ